jgi:hypothetical protein
MGEAVLALDALMLDEGRAERSAPFVRYDTPLVDDPLTFTLG